MVVFLFCKSVVDSSADITSDCPAALHAYSCTVHTDCASRSGSETASLMPSEQKWSFECITHMNGRQRKSAVMTADMTDRKMVDEEEPFVQDSDSEDGCPDPSSGIRGELGSVSLLLFLYVLQGIPLGLAGSIPLIMQSKNVSYKDQAYFSFVFWPFSLKLLWAPLVDSVYVKRFGRRKSWLIPTQYLLGLFMLGLSFTVDSLLQTSGPGGPSVISLTAVFFILAFLAATQDIAVDGWALTMLSRENVGYASTCNSVGQTAGYFLGNVLFLALESADFCNKYLRFEPQDQGIVTLSGMVMFFQDVLRST